MIQVKDSGFLILDSIFSTLPSPSGTVRAHDMFFFVCSATLFYLQRYSFLFAAFLFFICSVPFFIFAAVSFFVSSVLFFCLQRFVFVNAVCLFCLQRSFLFAACPLWVTVQTPLVRTQERMMSNIYR